MLFLQKKKRNNFNFSNLLSRSLTICNNRDINLINLLFNSKNTLKRSKRKPPLPPDGLVDTLMFVFNRQLQACDRLFLNQLLKPF